MRNDIKLGDSHPLSEELKPLKVNGETSSIETAKWGKGARINGDLEVTGTVNLQEDKYLPLAGGTMTGNIASSGDLTLDVGADLTLDVSGSDINLLVSGAKFGEIGASTTRHIILYEAVGSTDDYFKIATTSAGATTISTVDDAGTNGAIIIDADGFITLDSATGAFILKNNGTEFSIANSAYAGTIIGYTVDGLNQTPATYDLTTTETAFASSTHHVSFIAPPSGAVEIEVQIGYDAGNSAATVFLGLSDNTTIPADSLPAYFLATVYEPSSRQNDTNLMHKWVATGLTAGDTYKWYLTAKSSTTIGTPKLKWGADSASEEVMFIMKATALPTAVADFAIYS